MKYLNLIFFILLTKFIFSQQLIRFCELDSGKVSNYWTSTLSGSYFWTLDGSDVGIDSSGYQKLWTSDDIGNHTLGVIFMDQLGCYSDQLNLDITVDFCKEVTVFAPNVFTPNGDSINNVWKIEGENYYEGRVYIVNRWGEVVFETDNLEIGWDGTFKGMSCSEGVYIYSLIYKDSDGKLYQQTGHVTLIR
jgi:hypothetical protein